MRIDWGWYVTGLCIPSLIAIWQWGMEERRRAVEVLGLLKLQNIQEEVERRAMAKRIEELESDIQRTNGLLGRVEAQVISNNLALNRLR